MISITQIDMKSYGVDMTQSGRCLCQAAIHRLGGFCFCSKMHKPDVMGVGVGGREGGVQGGSRLKWTAG